MDFGEDFRRELQEEDDAIAAQKIEEEQMEAIQRRQLIPTEVKALTFIYRESSTAADQKVYFDEGIEIPLTEEGKLAKLAQYPPSIDALWSAAKENFLQVGREFRTLNTLVRTRINEGLQRHPEIVIDYDVTLQDNVTSPQEWIQFMIYSKFYPTDEFNESLVTHCKYILFNQILILMHSRGKKRRQIEDKHAQIHILDTLEQYETNRYEVDITQVPPQLLGLALLADKIK
jgi:hypothetical protein